VERKKREQVQPQQSQNFQQWQSNVLKERAELKLSEKGQAREKKPSINQERPIDRGFER